MSDNLVTITTYKVLTGDHQDGTTTFLFIQINLKSVHESNALGFKLIG